MIVFTLFAWALLGLVVGLLGLIAWSDRRQARAQRAEI